MELNYGKAFGNLAKSLLWGVAFAILGYLIGEGVGLAVALSICCYWRMCMIPTALPLFEDLHKDMQKLDRRQTINQALINDLEETRENINDLRLEFESFQIDLQKQLENKRKKSR